MSKLAKIFYFSLSDDWLKEKKLAFFEKNPLKQIPFETIKPSKKNNWLNLAHNDFEDLLPLFSKSKQHNTLFSLFGNASKSNRDDWVYDFNKKHLIQKVQFFIKKYNHQLKSEKFAPSELDIDIKWSRDIRNKLKTRFKILFDSKKILSSAWRPFVKKSFYSEKIMNDVLTENHYRTFGLDLRAHNAIINISDTSTSKGFSTLASNVISDYHFISDTKYISLYHYDASGNRHENITDWGLGQFENHYQDKRITKEAIFHYTYAVLYHPAYREKYALNLKREFPRLPFYADFWQWADWGKQLMALHIGYENAPLFAFERAEQKDLPAEKIKPKLRRIKGTNSIELDSKTTLSGIPSEAWDYKLGNRSALEWVLDQYKEKKPRDKTIAEKFNTYRFADYKNEVLVLLARVCTVSVETMKLIHAMPKEVEQTSES